MSRKLSFKSNCFTYPSQTGSSLVTFVIVETIKMTEQPKTRTKTKYYKTDCRHATCKRTIL